MQIRMLREIDKMFENVPQTRKTLEAKEEMLQNLMEKFGDLIQEGKSEEAAFNIAIASVGDISDLVSELSQPAPQVAKFPEPDMSAYSDGYTTPEPARAATPSDPDFARHHRGVVISVAVMLYILSPVAVILFGGRMGLLLMFVCIAAATGLLIYNGITNPNKAGAADASSESFSKKMSKRDKKFFGSLSGALWTMTTALYFVISFATDAWHITWIIFLIAAAATNVMKAFIDLNRGE